jgi:hypothetical protein
LRVGEERKRRVSRICDVYRKELVDVVRQLRVTGKVTAVVLSFSLGKSLLSDSQENVFDLQSVGRFFCFPPYSSIQDLHVIKASISLHGADFLLTNTIQSFSL